MDVVAEIKDGLKSLREAQQTLAAEIKALAEPVRGGTPANPATVPAIRSGENALGSRGYSYLRAAGLVRRHVDENECKVEIDVHNRLQSVLKEQLGYQKAAPNSFLMPFATDHLCLKGEESFLSEMRTIVQAGVSGADPEEVFALRRKFGVTKALSWIDQTSGGALVAPPVMGELIELFRNNEALLQLGARELPLPPNGRITWPRQTDAVSAYWVGEGEDITASEFTVGDLVLIAKKLGLLVKIPNELFRYSSVSMEQFIREDMMKSAALKFDKTALEGLGSTYQPRGLINYPNLPKHIASTTGANGDTFTPADVGKMIAKVEENNAEFKGWLMRPSMYSVIRNRRASAVTAGDGEGPFLFNVFRSLEENMTRGRGTADLEGYPCVKSTQVSNTRVKGSGVDLTYILGGNFSDVICAMGGVIEFLTSDKGDTAVTKDQTWVRGILHCDVGLRHEASLVLCDQLIVA